MRQRRLFWVGLFGLLYVSMIAGGLWTFHYLLHQPHVKRTAMAMAASVTRYGQRGGYVWEMQNRLRFLGYYSGKIDGVYGWKTLRAVRNFQSQFGLRVDGLVGPKTKAKLWLATRNWRGGGAGQGGFSTYDIEMMARAVHGEARGEPYIGKVAVAAVILNRVESAKFPSTPASVIFQPGAFTAVADGQIWITPDATSYQAVRDAINGWDPSSGALYYFNPVTATSKWIWTRPQIKRIGKHIFTR